MSPTSSDTLPVVDSGPESLFRIGTVDWDGTVVSASMPTGPWLTGPDGRTSPGALGVLVDNVLGYTIIGGAPSDHWSVSTEISIDLIAPLPTDAGSLHAEARMAHVDALGGLAVGRVTDDAGRLVAITRERGRHIPTSPSTGMTSVRFDVDPTVPDLETLLETRRTDDGLELEVRAILQNPMHDLHGGITLAVADLAAALALRDGGPELVTASIHVVYARGIPADAVLTVTPTVRHRGRSLATVDVTGSVAGRACTLARVTAQPAVL
ncbi:MAG: hypothetical protein JWO46_3057 [Nocardioidaceae bacterium]|nr:hypothetical protein [Nocardioidaceae bacterium]